VSETPFLPKTDLDSYWSILYTRSSDDSTYEVFKNDTTEQFVVRCTLLATKFRATKGTFFIFDISSEFGVKKTFKNLCAVEVAITESNQDIQRRIELIKKKSY